MIRKISSVYLWTQIVKDADRMSCFDESVHQMRPDKTGSSCDQNFAFHSVSGR
jgi:hypothetical protein